MCESILLPCSVSCKITKAGLIFDENKHGVHVGLNETNLVWQTLHGHNLSFHNLIIFWIHLAELRSRQNLVPGSPKKCQ